MKKNAGNMVWYIIKLLLVGYIISGIILGVLALMMWKGNPAAGLISGGLLFAYLISCFVGGLLLGKKIGVRKYLWGLLFGLLYFVVIFAGFPTNGRVACPIFVSPERYQIAAPPFRQ